MSTLQERIKEQRIAHHMTLSQVAGLLNIKQATVQRYESGDIKNIKQEIVRRMAEIFNCSPAYLMGWTEHPEPVEYELSPPLSYEEIQIIEGYRDHPEMRESVKKLLSINKDDNDPDNQTNNKRIIMAAFGGNGVVSKFYPRNDNALESALEDFRIQKAIKARKNKK